MKSTTTYTSSKLGTMTGTEIMNVYTNIDKICKPGTKDHEMSIFNISRHVIDNYPELVSVEQIKIMRSYITNYLKKPKNRRKKQENDNKKKIVISEPMNAQKMEHVKKQISTELEDDEIFVVVESKYSKLRLIQHDIAAIACSFDGINVKNNKIEQNVEKIRDKISKFDEMKYFHSFRSFIEQKNPNIVKFGYYVPIFIYAISKMIGISINNEIVLKSIKICEGLARREISVATKNGDVLKIKPLFNNDDNFVGNLVISHDHREFTARLARKIG